MPDAQDQHTVRLDPVADNIGTGERGLAKLDAGNRTAAIGEIGEVVADLDDPCGHVPRRVRIEVSDIPANPFNVGQSRKSPDNRPSTLRNGTGQFVRRAPGFEPLDHLFVRHEPTGCNVRLGLGDRARFGVLVDLKNGFGLGHKYSPTEFSVFPFSALET
jgi:hypothetical protein